MATLTVSRNSNFYIFFKYINRSKCRKLFSTEVKVKNEVESVKEIVVPYRIERGPTDILKALASTIKKDYTAAKYKYEDDPYFIPVSNVSKRSYALSKESGKRAARYFLEKYPHLFTMHKSDPPIKAFDPPVVYTEEDNVTEETLKSCIASFDVTNSKSVYEILVKKGVNVNEEVKEKLLELLCFYNCEQPPNEDYCEENWFRTRDKKRQRAWKVNNEAEKLFEGMEPKTAAAYCTIIQGTSKFFMMERTLTLYEDFCNKNLKGTTEMYNSLLDLVPYIKMDGEARWELAMHYAQKMNADGCKPNLATMNALLYILSKCRRWNKAVSLSTKVLAEMEWLCIEPSLATYYYILTIFCTNNQGYANVLPQILNKIGIQEFTIRHPEDISFFAAAMESCYHVCRDKDLAYRVNELLEYRNNCIFLGSSMFESFYFKNFFKLLCETEDFDKFMEVYDRYVPHTYTPEVSVMLKIITSLDFAMAYHHLPKICSDIMMFEHTERENILNELFAVISSCTDKVEEKVKEQLVTMVWHITEKVFKRAEEITRQPFQWPGSVLTDVMKIFLSSGDLEKTMFVLEKIQSSEHLILGYPDKSVFVQFCQTCIASKDFNKLAFCVKLVTQKNMYEIKEELLAVVNTALEQNQLTEKEKTHVRSLFDAYIVDEKTDKQGSLHEEVNKKNVDNALMD